MKVPANPYLLNSLEDAGRLLPRRDVDAREARSESWMQELLYRRPELLPVNGFDTSFAPLIPLGREIATGHGPLDLLYVSPEGLLTMVETKLWKNPEKHRTVAAQAIDYAKELAAWSYDELCGRVLEASRRRDGSNAKSFEDRIGPFLSQSGIGLHEFQEALVENLARGRFLVLIVGDRISPNLVLLSQAIQAAPGLSFTVGLVELELYRLHDGEDWPLLVVPTMVGRTVEVPRGVVHVKYEQEKPKIRIESDIEEEKSAPRDVDGFLETIPADLASVFREEFDRWKTIGGTLRTTSHRLFMEVELGGEPQKLVRLTSTGVNIVTRPMFEKFLPESSIYGKYLEDLDSSTVASNAARSERMWILYSELKPSDVRVILEAVRNLAEIVRAEVG